MDPHATSLTGLAIIALAALGCGIAMRYFKQPPVLGYIVAGTILGPSGAGLVENRDFIQILAEMGVLMLLFVIAMELSLRGIRDVWKIALATTVLQIAVGLSAMIGLGYFMDWPLPLAILLGFVVALSSTAVAVKMLEETGEKKTRVGKITIGILIAQDLAVVPMMLIINSFHDAGIASIGWEAIFKVAVSIGTLIVLIAFISRSKRLSLPFTKAIGNNNDLTPLAGLAFCFGAAAVSGLLGLSAAYGAFLAGLIIGNSTSQRAMIHHTAPIQSILLMIFFLSVGLLIDINYIWANLWTVILIVSFVAIFKTGLNIILIRLLGETWPSAFLSGALLAQLGEFSFVIAAVGFNAHVLSTENYGLIIAVTALSLAISSFWLETARRLHRIALLGITSGRETIRLVFGREAVLLVKSTSQSNSFVTDLVGGLARWIGYTVPPRPKDKPSEETPPASG